MIAPPQRARSAAATLLLALALALAASPAEVAAVPAAAAAASSASFHSAARAVDPGGELAVTGYRLEGDAADSTLQLERFEVWAPGARVWLQAAATAPPQQVAPPATRYFRGSIAGQPGSSAMLAVRPDGGVSGSAQRGNASWVLGKPGAPRGASAAAAAAAAAAPLRSRRAVAGTQDKPPFRCQDKVAPQLVRAQPQGPQRQLLQVRGWWWVGSWVGRAVVGTCSSHRTHRHPARPATAPTQAHTPTHAPTHPPTTHPHTAVHIGPAAAGQAGCGDRCRVLRALQRGPGGGRRLCGGPRWM